MSKQTQLVSHGNQDATRVCDIKNASKLIATFIQCTYETARCEGRGYINYLQQYWP